MIEDITELTAKHTYGTWRAQRGWKPMNVTKAEGVYFWGGLGQASPISSSQLVCSNRAPEPGDHRFHLRPGQEAGLHQPRAHLRRARRAGGEAPRGDAQGPRQVLLRHLREPEANEAAINIARLYTGKHKIISRYTSYHGSTAGVVAATGDMRRWFIEPTGKIPGVIFAPETNCYRCPLGQTYPSCNTAGPITSAT